MTRPGHAARNGVSHATRHVDHRHDGDGRTFAAASGEAEDSAATSGPNGMSPTSSMVSSLIRPGESSGLRGAAIRIGPGALVRLSEGFWEIRAFADTAGVVVVDLGWVPTAPLGAGGGPR